MFNENEGINLEILPIYEFIWTAISDDIEGNKLKKKGRGK